MKDKILPILLVSVILASCSSVYRSGQTPDDVYYSPAREVVKTEQKEEQKEEDKTASTEDQYLKMKVRDRYRWSRIDDYDYWVDTRYNTHCSCTCNPPSSYGYYPIRYNTYHSSYVPYLYGNVKYVKGNTTASTIKAYNNHNYSNTNTSVNPKTGAANNNGVSDFLRRVITSSGSTVDRPDRTITPSSSGSTNTSSSAGGRSGGMNTSGSGSSSGRSRGN